MFRHDQFSRFQKNINKMHKGVIIPQFANIVCMQVSGKKTPQKNSPVKDQG